MLKRVDPSWRKGFEWNKEWDGSEERLFAYAGDYWWYLTPRELV
jgi:hypothetical protein